MSDWVREVRNLNQGVIGINNTVKNVGRTAQSIGHAIGDINGADDTARGVNAMHENRANRSEIGAIQSQRALERLRGQGDHGYAPPGYTVPGAFIPAQGNQGAVFGNVPPRGQATFAPANPPPVEYRQQPQQQAPAPVQQPAPAPAPVSAAPAAPVVVAAAAPAPTPAAGTTPPAQAAAADAAVPAASGAAARLYKGKDGTTVDPDKAPTIAANQVEAVQKLIGAEPDKKWGPESQAKFGKLCASLNIDPHKVNFTDDKNPERNAVLAHLSKAQAQPAAAKPQAVSAAPAADHGPGEGGATPAATATAQTPAQAAAVTNTLKATLPLSTSVSDAVTAPVVLAAPPVVTAAAAPREIGESQARHNFLAEASKTLGFGGGLNDQQIITKVEEKFKGQPGFTPDGKLDAAELATTAKVVDANKAAINFKNPDMAPALDALLKQEGIKQVAGVYTDGKAAQNNGPQSSPVVVVAGNDLGAGRN